MSLFERPLLGDEYSPKKNAPLIFMPVTIVACMFALCGIVCNMIVLFDGPDGTKATTIFKLRILRIFGVIFCCMMISAEVEWKQFLDTCAILRNWVARSIFYFFLGAMTLSADKDKWYYEFCFVISFSITALAGLYFIMGCIRLMLVGKG
mmetsp:Transcript_50508/g.86543  ORF Transcript_50508/g.86543 Transcript_50508/m.86543 type:complete len:150 (-) Transcript_50508:318-767(-)